MHVLFAFVCCDLQLCSPVVAAPIVANPVTELASGNSMIKTDDAIESQKSKLLCMMGCSQLLVGPLCPLGC